MNRKTRRTMKARGIKMPRSEAEIRQDYSNTCTQAGECQYRIMQLENSLEQLNEKLDAINKEFAALAASQPAPAPVEEPKATLAEALTEVVATAPPEVQDVQA